MKIMSSHKEKLGKPDTMPVDGPLQETMVYEKVYDWMKSGDYWIVVGMVFDQQLRTTMEELENRYFTPDTEKNSKFWILIMNDISVLIYVFPKKDVSRLYVQTNISGFPIPEKVSFIIIGSVMGMISLQIQRLMDGVNTVAEARGDIEVRTEGR